MRRPSIVFRRIVGALVAFACFAPATVHAASLADEERRLAVATTPALLRRSCERVAVSLLDPHSPDGAGAFASINRFVRSTKSVDARAQCLRDARNIVRSTQTAPSHDVAAIDALEVAMLGSPRSADQVVGATAAYAEFNGKVGRLLARLAGPDRKDDVRVAALGTLSIPMMSDVHGGTDPRLYDTAIVEAMHDRNVNVVAAAVGAYGSLHGSAADPTFLDYGTRADPLLRAGILEQLARRPLHTAINSQLFQRGLRDPDRRVRLAALDELASPNAGDLRLLEAFARSAATREERENARGQLSTFARDARSNERTKS